MVEIKGQIERVTYFNEENGYVVARLKAEGHMDLVTIVGTVPGLNPGEVLKLKGEWQSHPKYGKQFKISSCETAIPATVAGMERYLASGMIKGIGPVMAKRLVTRFGTETLDVIEQDTERLKEVEGIGEKRVEMIRSAWQAQREIREVMIFLQGHGVSPAYAVKIFKQYGSEAVPVVRENPYRLAEEVFGIGFITADKIAEKLGIEKESLIRARAGVQFILNRLSDEGHVYFPFDRLVEEAEKTLEIDRGIILDALASAAADRRVVIEEMDAFGREGKAVYLIRFHVSEQGIARRMQELLACPRQLPLVNLAGHSRLRREGPRFCPVRAAGEGGAQFHGKKGDGHHRRAWHRQDHHYQGHRRDPEQAGSPGASCRTHRQGREEDVRDHGSSGQDHPQTPRVQPEGRQVQEG